MSEPNESPEQSLQLAIIADRDTPPVKLSDVLDELVPTGVKLKAENIIGKEFTMLRARSFPSKFRNQTHAYFVVGIFAKGGKLFNTVLGGSAVLDVLDALAKGGFHSPLVCTLRQVSGGSYGQYYVLE